MEAHTNECNQIKFILYEDFEKQWFTICKHKHFGDLSVSAKPHLWSSSLEKLNSVVLNHPNLMGPKELLAWQTSIYHCPGI